MRRSARHNPMDQLSSCRVALQDAAQEAENVRVKLAAVASYIEWRIHNKNTDLSVASEMVTIRNMLKDRNLWVQP